MTIENAKIISTQTSPDEYHLYGNKEYRRGDKDYTMSRSELMEFYHCPHRWLKGFQKKRTEAMSYGNMFDGYVLDKERFDSKFVITPKEYYSEIKKVDMPWTLQANSCKEWTQEQETLGKAVIKSTELDKCINAKKALFEDEIIKSFFDCSDKQVMIVANWKNNFGMTVPLKCLVDLVPEKGSIFETNLADLKTCNSAHPDVWSNEIFKWKYYVQAAFYMDMHEAATGEIRNEFNHILSESFSPYEVGLRYIEEEFIEKGREIYEAALYKYCVCLSSNKFGGYDDYTQLKFKGFSSVGPKIFMFDNMSDKQI